MRVQPKYAVLLCLLLYLAVVKAQDIRPFTIRYTTDARGKMVMVANNIITTKKKSSGGNVNYARVPPSCPGSGELCKNDDQNNTNIDIDGDAATFNSSGATLTLPTCHSILYAALYWGAGITINQGSNGALPLRSTGWNNVLVKAPGRAYQSVTATTIDTMKSVFHGYQAFADITQLVRDAGAGMYTIANVKCDTVNASGTALVNAFGGWTLMVIYADPSQPLRNFTIFDGLSIIGNSSGINSRDIKIKGFKSPPSGNISATLGMVVYDGDRGEKDGFFVKRNAADVFTNQTATAESAKALANADDAWNSSITDTGSLVTTRMPAHQNTYGYDAHMFRLNNTLNRYLRNNEDSAVVRISTSSEGYVLGLVTSEIDTYYPELILENAVEAVHPAAYLFPGDTLQITSTVRNTGNNSATGVRAEDRLPAHFSYVPNSIYIDNVQKTDASGDDAGEYLAGSRTVVARLGLGGNITAGGATYELRYKIVITAACAAEATDLPQQTRLYFQDQASTVLDSTGSRPKSIDNCVAAMGAGRVTIQPCLTVLASKLVQFTASNTRSGIYLQWIAEEHRDVTGYTVESSTDGVHFKAIDSRAVPLQDGRFSYSFTDSRGYGSTKIYYRLRISGNRNKNTFSKVLLVNHAENNNMQLLQASPDAPSIIIKSGKPIAFVQWFNEKGQFVRSTQNVSAGQPIAVGNLPAGVYFLRVFTDDSMQVLKMLRR